MDDELKRMVAELEKLSLQLDKRKQELLAANPADFISAFVSLAKVAQSVQRTQDLLEPRADFMANNEQDTIRKLRKDQFRVI